MNKRTTKVLRRSVDKVSDYMNASGFVTGIVLVGSAIATKNLKLAGCGAAITAVSAAGLVCTASNDVTDMEEAAVQKKIAMPCN